MLSALAIFVGGFTREAAEAVAGASLGVLAALAERSLIQRLPDAQGGSRYQVHELVRHYALRHLEDDGTIRGRHFGYFLELVETLETSWNTQLEPLWSNPIVADLANVSAAMVWVLDQGDAEGALRMAVGPRQVLDLLCSPAHCPPGVAGSRAGSAVVAVECHQYSRQSKGVSLSGLLKARADALRPWDC